MTFGFSARPVQIATVAAVQRLVALVLCLHMPRADCNYYIIVKRKENLTFASTRPVQIATSRRTDPAEDPNQLCLHTPRADCNVRLAMLNHPLRGLCLHTPRADCNAVTVAPRPCADLLCLHTPRADCNRRFCKFGWSRERFASTRPVQIATQTVNK